MVAVYAIDSVLSAGAAVRADGHGPVYLPIVTRGEVARPAFAVQSNHLSRSAVLDSAKKLGASWVRIQGLSWWQAQPVRFGKFDWQAAWEFERHLRAANEAGMTPTVVIWDSPAWATINKPQPTSCGAIRADRFDEYAAFLHAAVQRYSQPPFNVHYWELGNEPDVDPRIPSTNAVWGCWGDTDDYWYGGEHYGRMLNAVAPAIRAADPTAKIVFGGLLLDRPNTVTQAVGKPERFLEGALRAGAAGSFDILAFHVYAGFAEYGMDTDLLTEGVWPGSGRVRGKAAFLRGVMAQYHVNKPLWANEVGLICYYCDVSKEDPPPGFLETQADMLPRLLARAMSVHVQQVAWYTLENSDWLFSGLMGKDETPRPAYYTYQELIRRVGEGPVTVDQVSDYGPNIEAYRFSTVNGTFDLAWANSYRSYEVRVPVTVFKGAYSRDGSRLGSSISGDQVHVTVGFSPVYIVRRTG